MMSDEELAQVSIYAVQYLADTPGTARLVHRLVVDYRRMRDALRSCDPVILDTFGKATCRFCGGETFQPHIPHAETCIWREVQDGR